MTVPAGPDLLGVFVDGMPGRGFTREVLTRTGGVWVDDAGRRVHVTCEGGVARVVWRGAGVAREVWVAGSVSDAHTILTLL